MFLTLDDYRTLAPDALVHGWAGQDAAVLQAAEAAALAELESYLRDRYDTQLLFNSPYPTPQGRNPLLVRTLVDMVLYHLQVRLGPRAVSTLRATRYQAALNWLALVAAGTVNPNFPLRPQDNQGNDVPTWVAGSNAKLTQQY